MERPRGTKSKADQIKAFLARHQPKLSEARGFLQFMLSKEEILRRTELVTDLSGAECAILVSAKGSGTWPFLFRRGDKIYTKTSQAVVELMKSVPEHIALYLSTEPPEWSEERQEFLNMLARWHDEVFREDVDRVTRRQELLRQIDEALERGDRGAFHQLAAELRRLD